MRKKRCRHKWEELASSLLCTAYYCKKCERAKIVLHFHAGSIIKYYKPFRGLYKTVKIKKEHVE